MKKLLLTLLMLFTLGLAAQAASKEVTYDFSQKTYGMTDGTYLADGYTLTETPVVITLNKNAGSNGFRLWSGALRFHKSSNSSMTIAAGGATITKIELTVNGANFALDSSSTGTWANNTWTGAATSIKLNYTTNGNKDVNKIVVTYEAGDEDPNAVSISANTGDTKYLSGNTYEVEAGTEVTFTVENYEGATITAAVGNDFVDFVDGSYTATINEDTEVSIEVEKGDKTVSAEYTFTVKVVPVLDGTGWVLVTDAAQLNAGDLLIIASGSTAAGNKDYTKNRPSVDVTITENVLTYSETAENQPLIVKLGGSTGKWTFETTNYLGTDGYLASATSGSNNHLKVQSTAMTATIAIGSNNNATVVFDAGGSFNRTTLMKNSNSALFACYSGGQDPIQLYKYVAPDPELDGEPTINVTHASKKGVLIVEYSFNIANHNGKPVAVTATIDGKEHIAFVDATPANAPARVAGESTTVSGTLRAEHADLVDASNLNVNLKATLDGQEFFTRQATVTTTTGIEDVMVDGEGEAEYFNLQGLRVAQPEAGQLYIKRQAGKAVKVRF